MSDACQLFVCVDSWEYFFSFGLVSIFPLRSGPPLTLAHLTLGLTTQRSPCISFKAQPAGVGFSFTCNHAGQVCLCNHPHPPRFLELNPLPQPYRLALQTCLASSCLCAFTLAIVSAWMPHLLNSWFTKMLHSLQCTSTHGPWRQSTEDRSGLWGQRGVVSSPPRLSLAG